MLGELAAEIVGKAFIEGLCFLTGKGSLHLLSFGRLIATLDSPRQQRFAMTFVVDGRRHIHHIPVILIGLLFWSAIIVAIISIF